MQKSVKIPPVIDPADERTPLFEFWRPTRDWIGACLGRLADGGIAASVLREGDGRRGTVLIVLDDGAGTWIPFAQIRSADGHAIWVPVGSLPRDGDDPAGPAITRDPDLWILRMDAAGFLACLDGTAAAPAPRPADTRSPRPAVDRGDRSKRRVT